MLQRNQLYPYQEHAVGFIKSKPNCALWVDCGLGKTVSTLTAYADMKNSFDVNKMLVIAPLRVARKVWSDEITEWTHLKGLTVSCITGTAAECFQSLQESADIHTINRERLPWLYHQFFKDGKQTVRFPWDMVVADESQSFKNQTSERSKALRHLRPLFTRMTELTGTPIPNGYMDLWFQMLLMDGGKRLGTSQEAFRDRFFTPPVGMFTKWILRPGHDRLIREKIRDVVLSLREEDYLSLPPVVENFVRCELSSAAMAKYKEMERECIAEVAGKKLTAVNAGVLDGKLLQLANGACYHGAKGEWVAFHDEKLNALDELLESMSGKALIGYTFKHDLARISKVLDARCKADGKTWRVLVSDDDFSAWARGEIGFGLLHPASAGHGLNDVWKAGAEDLIHYGLTNNLEWFIQLNKRLTGGHRRASRNVRLHYIVTDGTRDADYVRLLKSKNLTQDTCAASLAVKIAG